MIYIILAWRNMWRSRRRTLITVSSIFFAVLMAIGMRTVLIGIFDNMIYNTVSSWCGYLQIHHKNYWDNKSVDSSFLQDPALNNLLAKEPLISAWSPHLESFALASSGERTKGIDVLGIDPEKENAVSRLSNELTEGSYLSDSDHSIMLAEGLAKYLQLNLRDTVVLLGQGFEGDIAAGKYEIRGIIKLGIPEMNNSMAWLPLAVARNFLGTGPRLSSISIMVNNREEADPLRKTLLAKLGVSDYEIMNWQEMNPGLDQIFQAKMAQNKIMSGILYLVIAFGIFGTILMMMNERQHEFGILVAIGMKKNQLSLIILAELMILSVIATLSSIICCYPLVLYFRKHPIRLSGAYAKISEQFNFVPLIRPNKDISNFLVQGYVVIGIVLFLSCYAIYKIYKLKAIQAINS